MMLHCLLNLESNCTMTKKETIIVLNVREQLDVCIINRGNISNAYDKCVNPAIWESPLTKPSGYVCCEIDCPCVSS